MLSQARRGATVTIVPGNHDEYLRRFCDLQLGNIMVTAEAVHRLVDGRLLLVVHGDEFDGITRYHRWVAVTGDVGYEILLVLSRWFNRLRRPLRLPYWSLSAYVVCYAWVVRAPWSFRRWCARSVTLRTRSPVVVLRRLFYGFKLLQLSVFAIWCLVNGDGRMALAPSDVAVVVGLALIIAGQFLNAMVFYRLGATGVFYGDRLGHALPWCRDFPFSLMTHPQYVGVVLSIWGLFLALRFPYDDWFLVPALETVYYVLGARLEDPGMTAAPTSAIASSSRTGCGPRAPRRCKDAAPYAG